MGSSPLTITLASHPSLKIQPKLNSLSLRHFNKHLTCTKLPSSPIFKTNLYSKTTKTHFIKPIRNSFQESFSLPIEKKNFTFESVKKTIFEVNIVKVLKYVLLGFTGVSLVKLGVGSLLSPFFWMYFSWTWVFWPWYVALGLGVYGVYGFSKHVRGDASVVEQLGIVTSVFTWLTLVPPGFVNGFLEGWPFVFWFVYHYFFFLNVSIRKRLYGDFYPREHDGKWDVNVPNLYRVLFCVGVVIGHWFAAFEGPQLHLIPGGWSNLGIWGLILSTVFLHYHSTLYLAKYSEKVVVPTAVVQFGPYRWVRHPIYASTGLLFLSYFIALRAPLSSLFIVAVCLMYYDQKAKLEEGLMVETFGDGYTEYMKKVKYKFIPFVY